MQEKVHFHPPEIKIFEGKPPPTSWVSENIVRYYHIQSEYSLLTDILEYAQNLQSDHLAQRRPQSTLMKESYAPVGEEGSATDIANTSTFNSAQSYLKTQILYLEKLMAVLKQGDPKLSPMIDSLLAQLKQISQNFPHFSNLQIQNLNELMEKLLSASQKVPPSSQRAFWNTQLYMLQELMTNNNQNIKDLQSEIKGLQGRMKLLSSLEELLQKIQTTMQSRPPKPEQLLELIEDLQHLANHVTQLNPEQQQALMSFFHQLSQFNTAKGVPFSQITADATVSAKLNTFLKNNPNASPNEIKEFLKSFLKESNLQQSHLPFMKQLGDSIEELVNKRDFPTTQGYTQESFASQSTDNKITANDDLIHHVSQGYAPHPESVEELHEASSAVIATTTEEKVSTQTQVEGYKAAADNLKVSQSQFGKAAVSAVHKSYAAGTPPPGAAAPKAGQSLPNQFANAILNHYMPGQEAYLQSLAMLLYLDNMGAEFGNTLLDHMMGFGNAADSYDFSNWLHKADNGNFTGSVTQAQQQLSNEKAACAQDIKDAIAVEKELSDELQQINAQLQNKNLTPAQKAILTKMQTKIQGMQQSMLKIYTPATTTTPASGQLADMQNILNQLTVGPPSGNPPPDSSKYYNIYGPNGSPQPPPANWESTLSSCESKVINGDPKGNPPGGLVNIQNDAQTFQQNYSDQSQNQQMVLQMRMTEIQQEWTVVSTALQLLNQMYMTVSQAIYK